VKKYSNFISFPILIDAVRANTVEPLWSVSDRSKITDAQYKEFYKFISNSFDDPLYRLHVSSDVPISIKALLYVPESNMPFAFARGGEEKGGVSLYSRKVLILSKSKELLPEWARFVRGEPLPINFFLNYFSISGTRKEKIFADQHSLIQTSVLQVWLIRRIFRSTCLERFCSAVLS
jgi:hypothetical protein